MSPTLEAGVSARLFEDREGNLWAGGGRGLERIRDSVFVTYTLTAGSAQSKDGGPIYGGPIDAGPIYVDSENRTWFAPAGGGLVPREGRPGSSAQVVFAS